MRRSFIYALGAFAVAAAHWLCAAPVRAIAFVREAFGGWIGDARPLHELFAAPTLALSTPGGDQIEGSLYQRNRHEAGIARLGAVRHT